MKAPTKAGPWDGWQQALERVLDALDWRALGDVYFHEDGEQLLRNRREPLHRLGTIWSRALLRRLPQAGRSLHVGAGLAELPAMLAEILVAGRSVRAVNLRGEECAILDRALQQAGLGDRLRIEHGDAGAVESAEGYDHLGVVSLFTDPETWPTLSDISYGRICPVQVDVDAFVRERDHARGIAQRLWSLLRKPGWITTSADELGWFLDRAEAEGVPLEADDALIETAMVGDPIGFVRVG